MLIGSVKSYLSHSEYLLHFAMGVKFFLSWRWPCRVIVRPDSPVMGTIVEIAFLPGLVCNGLVLAYAKRHSEDFCKCRPFFYGAMYDWLIS